MQQMNTKVVVKQSTFAPVSAGKLLKIQSLHRREKSGESRKEKQMPKRVRHDGVSG
jgi:hypothetical protein